MAGFRVGIVQAAPRGSKAETLKAVDRLLGRAVEPSLIVTPEYLMIDPTGLPRERIEGEAEELEGEWLGFFRDKAREMGACFAATLLEKAGDGRVYNTLAFIDRNGALVSVYRKTHLFDAYGYRESSFTKPGESLFEPVSLCGLRVGAAICFELRFPEIFRAQALRGAELVVTPAAWYRGPLKEEALRFLAQARAHENTVFLVVASNPGANFVGRSMIVDPMGVVRADAGPGERYVEHEIDPGEVEEARRILPVLRLRRPSLYPSM
ncbi:carbon-nitrogen hydrolase family protein [Stetteria hydrogenophila]